MNSAITYELTPEAPGPAHDFAMMNHGSVVTFHPLTAEAQAWWNEHVQPSPAFGNAFAVEPRYVLDLVAGIEADGFTIA